jgi:hypothetical protein
MMPTFNAYFLFMFSGHYRKLAGAGRLMPTPRLAIIREVPDQTAQISVAVLLCLSSQWRYARG